MPRIGYQDGSQRSEWYAVERLLQKYASIYGINFFVYVPGTLFLTAIYLKTLVLGVKLHSFLFLTHYIAQVLFPACI